VTDPQSRRRDNLLASVAETLLSSVPAAVVGRSRTLPAGSSRIASLVALAARPVEGRPLVVRHGEARGLQLRADRRSVAWITGKVEPEVQHALRRLLPSGGTFVDIGAGIGFFAALGARIVGPTGRVIAFEPSSAAAGAARDNCALNRLENVEIVELAVSDGEGRRFLARPGEPTATLEGAPAASAVEVSTVSLDHFLAQRPRLVPSLVKIDVEAHEAQVLRGMHETLSRVRPTLIIEMHGDSSFVRTLEGAGYGCSVLEGAGSVATAPWWAHVLAVPRG
jgi:FkbM family methyltransferase